MCAQVFHTNSLVYYAEQKVSGREFPKKFVGDDIHQVCFVLSDQFSAAFLHFFSIKLSKVKQI